MDLVYGFYLLGSSCECAMCPQLSQDIYAKWDRSMQLHSINFQILGSPGL